MNDHVNENRNSGGVAELSPRPALESSREWIEKRYGPITIQRDSVMFDGDFSAVVVVVVAAVPVMGGIALGVGRNEDYAINSLRGDLSGETRARQLRAQDYVEF